MKRIAIVVAALSLLATGAAFAGTEPAGDCTCQASQTQGSRLGTVELSP